MEDDHLDLSSRCWRVARCSDRLCVALFRIRPRMRAATAVPSCMCGFVRRNGGRKRIVHIGGSAGNKLRAKLN
jgi:hypothetical protein